MKKNTIITTIVLLISMQSFSQNAGRLAGINLPVRGRPVNVIMVRTDSLNVLQACLIDSIYLSQFNISHLSDSLLSKPTRVQTDILYKSASYVPAWTDVTGKPSFATVATSGSYNDLSNKPVIIGDSVIYYNASGRVYQKIRVWTETVTPSTGNGYSVDISSAGFSTILGYSAIGVKNTATVTSIPNVAVKSVSTSAMVLNITEGNASTVNILGSLVLLGAATVYANTSGLTVQVQVVGY